MPLDSFQSLFVSCPEMLLVAGRDGAVLHTNEAVVRALGPVHEGIGLVDLAHPDDRDAVAAGLLQSGEPRVELTCRVRCVDGSYAPHALSLWTAPLREEVYVALRPAAGAVHAGPSPGAHTDLAMVEPPLELDRGVPGISAAMILRAILDNLPIVVWATDTRGCYLFSEGKALETVGLKPGLVVGKLMGDLAPGATDPGTPMARSMAGEHIHQIGNYVGRWWENWHIPVRDASGHVASVAGVSLDITETKRAEQEVTAKLETIEQQQQTIREIGVPIIEVWDSVLALPMIGVIDTRRAAEMMDNLLEMITRRRARYAILDLTGVGMVDSGTARHLIGLTRAVALLGAEGIITGIRPGVAQTMATMGLDLAAIRTLADLREGIRYCIGQAAKRGDWPA
jgi:rsbT co-antagonist protein RsbR